jgi:dienelactone hydrolase
VAGERPDWEWYLQASELVAAGRLDDAESRIKTAFQAGHLWRVSLLAAPPLEPLRGRAGFEALAAEATRRVEALHLEPKLLVASASGRSGVAPMVMVLHGARGTGAEELERWRPATELGYIVAAAQSSQPTTADTFCWDPPRERILHDLGAIAKMLPPHGRIVMAGFSQGAWIALNQALEGRLFIAGSVVMVAPFAGPDANLPPAWRRLKVFIVVGEHDTYREPVERLARRLQERGHHVSIEVVPGLGHGYPEDFASRLPRLLRP